MKILRVSMTIHWRNCFDLHYPHQATGRAGMTAVELLVVIGTISLLASLLIPAVQVVRAAARATQCENNLHQIGVAAHSFHASHGFLMNEGRALRSLLPDLDQAVLADRLNQDDFQLQVTPAVLVCPDDFMAERSLLHFNYVINSGHGFGVERKGRGVREGLRFSEVTDGLSNTAYMSEKLVLISDLGARSVVEGKQFPLRYRFETLHHFVAGQEVSFAQHCLSEEIRQQVTSRGGWVANSLYYDSRKYDHLLPPNCWSFSNRNADPDDGIRISGGEAASSLHPGGGMYLLRLDGSVDFVSSGIDLNVYRGMGSISGGETLN